MAHAAEGPLPVDRVPRLRGAPAPNHASVREPRRGAALFRALAALALVMLLGATGLVFTMSRPLADVDIEVVSLTQASCRGSEACLGPRRASVRGTVAASSGSRDMTVLVMVRTGPRGEWSVAAEAQPDQSGAWSVADLALPPEAEPTVEVRAVLSATAGRVYSERETEAGVEAAVPASRVVRVAPEVPALERGP